MSSQPPGPVSAPPSRQAPGLLPTHTQPPPSPTAASTPTHRSTPGPTINPIRSHSMTTTSAHQRKPSQPVSPISPQQQPYDSMPQASPYPHPNPSPASQWPPPAPPAAPRTVSVTQLVVAVCLAAVLGAAVPTLILYAKLPPFKVHLVLSDLPPVNVHVGNVPPVPVTITKDVTIHMHMFDRGSPMAATQQAAPGAPGAASAPQFVFTAAEPGHQAAATGSKDGAGGSKGSSRLDGSGAPAT